MIRTYGQSACSLLPAVGAIFKINGDGNGYALLHHVQTNGVDGGWPVDSLVQGPDGTLYGTTLRGGSAAMARYIRSTRMGRTTGNCTNSTATLRKARRRLVR